MNPVRYEVLSGLRLDFEAASAHESPPGTEPTKYGARFAGRERGPKRDFAGESPFFRSSRRR